MTTFVKIFSLISFICITACYSNNGNKPLDAKKVGSDTIRLRKTKFKDHFNSLLIGNWIIQKYSFAENGCEMNPSQIQVKDSVLKITVELNEKNNVKPYKGGELGSAFPFLYGKFTVRLKNNIAPGTVSSFYIMNKWQPENWEHKEIDIEFLGNNTKAVQFTVHHFENGGTKDVYYTYTHSLGFDSSMDYHDYSVEWTKDSISWFVDYKWAYTEKRMLIDEPMYIRLNHWAAAIVNNNFIYNWLGPVDVKKLPSTVYYDFIKYTPM